MAAFHCQARTFLWRIRNFHMSPHLPGESILSPAFSFDPAGFLDLHLRLYPRGVSDSDAGRFVSLYLVRDPLDNGPQRVCVDFKLTLGWGREERVFEDCSCFRRGSKSGDPRLVSRRELLEGRDSPRDLLVTCEFAVGDEDGETYDPWEAGVRDLEGLSSDFREALEVGKHCDLMLKSSDGFLFRAHKAIVFQRFPEMVESLVVTHEGGNEEHEIDICESGLRSLLTYLYSGTLDTIPTSDLPHEMLHDFNNSQLRSLLFPAPSAESVSTTLTVKRGSFVWTIPGFRTTPGKTEWRNTFCVDERIVLSVSCERTATAANENDSEEDCVHFTIKGSTPDVSLYVEFHARLCETDAQIFGHLLEPGKCWTTPPIEISNGIRGDTLKINFVFHVSDGRFLTEIESCHQLEDKQSQLRSNLWGFQEDMRYLYTKSCMSDVVISAGKRRFLSHACVLSTRSPVFSRILEEKASLGEKTFEINLQDIGGQAVKCLLSCMYCGEVLEKPRNLCAVVDLCVAANRYQVKPLEEKCMSCLKRGLTAETVFKVVAQISQHKCEPLEKLVKTFLYMDREEILNSSEWEFLKSNNTYMSRDMENIISVPEEVMSDILWDMLLHLRWGKLRGGRMDIDLAIKLCEYAKRYKLIYMKHQYISIIQEKTKLENLGKLMASFNKCRDRELERLVHCFIRRNNSQIVKSNEWKTLACSREDLAGDLAKITSNPIKFSTGLITHVLHYLHTGKFVDTNDIAFLYIETCVHDLPQLGERFGSLLGSLITAGNVGEMSVISHMSGDEAILKQHIENFILSSMDKIVNSDKWKKVVTLLCLDEDAKAIAVCSPELRPTVITTMLTFMHSGLPDKKMLVKSYGRNFAARELTTKQVDLDFVIHLYWKVSKYQLQAIKQFCVPCIKKLLRASNVGRVLVLAVRNNDEELKEWAVTYVTSNVKAILDYSDWKRNFKDISGLKKYPKKLLVGCGKDFQVDAIVTMLLYMYGKNSGVKFDADYVMKLSRLADTLNLPKIKSDCQSLIVH